ncbi:MAG: response regulator transcription factor, partial [Povalibacter sp.]
MAIANAKAQPLTNGKLKLMICDDSNIIRRKIERELQIDRLQVIATAANGKLAVEAFRKEPADVVTMDITMPEMDGIECV